MRLDFRIEWGYQYPYSRRIYHPFYLWDGSLECENGSITECRRLDYPVLWFGPGQCARETPLPKAEWKNRTKRGISGVRILADADAGAVFHLKTASGNFDFTARQIMEAGRLRFPVGPKYLDCNITVTRTGFLWFRPPAKPARTVWEARDLAGEHHDWARMETVWLRPDGGQLQFSAQSPARTDDYAETVIHLQAMAAPAPGYTPDRERQCRDIFPIGLFRDGKPAAELKQFLRRHDDSMQMLEDIWIRIPAIPGEHEYELRNRNPRNWLLVNRITVGESVRTHLELSLPAWALVNEPLIGRIFSVKEDTTVLHLPGEDKKLAIRPGWNEFEFTLSEPGTDIEISTPSSRGTIGAVYDLKEEPVPVKVGFDMTVVPHDRNGFMDWLLDYTWRTRLGNLVVFRPFYADATAEDWREWGEFCRGHHLFVESTKEAAELPKTLAEGAGNYLHSMGMHEAPGVVYARDPAPEWKSADMREAAEHYLAYLKPFIAEAHAVSARAAFGDASGGHRYCYLAGIDFIRSETMVPHTQHLLSQARPAAEALGSGEWGVHIAIQHCHQLYSETHLGQYYLSLLQPWMMGAAMIYEEDSLFLLFKEERQSWDDALTRGKREMTRAFYRFAKTHPRSGKCVRKIAFLEGRYAAPFNGFICGTEQTPDYSVWGLFGNDGPEWGHRQPEKCRQLLDVLMPGAGTLPLRQRFDRRRFFFSGTPYGDFDEVPVECGAEYLKQYSLLLNLGWNTMIEEDYAKLREFVVSGGTLVTGIPQFSRHVRRDFLLDMSDLALWNSGDLSELCGIRVDGSGTPCSGEWNAAGRENFPEPELSSQPNHSPDEDGPALSANVEVTDGEVAAWDAGTGAPLVVKHRFGKGCVYTFTIWAYPGHERFQALVSSWIAFLAEKARGEIRVDDPSREVFYTVWKEQAASRLMLLNTDWTTPGNGKKVTVKGFGLSFETEVRERACSLITFLNGTAVECPQELHLEVIGGKVVLYGTGSRRVLIHRKERDELRQIDFGTSTSKELVL